MTPLLEAALSGNDSYDSLPASVRLQFTLKEWLWLSDREKATLVQQETEPEWME